MNEPLNIRPLPDRAASWLLGTGIVTSLLGVVGLMAIYMVPRGPVYTPLEAFVVAAAAPLIGCVAVAVNWKFAGGHRHSIRQRSVAALVINGLPLLLIVIEFIHVVTLD